MAVQLMSLGPLVDALLAGGYRVVGQVVRDGAIVLCEVDSADALPYGWGVETATGRYRLRERGDWAAFGYAAGPQSWKQFLCPPRRPRWTAKRTGGAFAAGEPGEAAARYAFLGVRPCDLRAIAVLDRVLGKVDGSYARRRAGLFMVAVACTEPADTCFCAATGTGPALTAGYDLALTELVDSRAAQAQSGSGEAGHRQRLAHAVTYLAEAATPAGADVLAALPTRAAPAELVDRASATVAAAAGRMRRSYAEADRPALLAGARNAAGWDDLAGRWECCGNDSMACPTCFRTLVEEATDATGDHAQPWQRRSPV